MTVIDQDIVVPFGDGEVCFENPGNRAWTLLLDPKDAAEKEALLDDRIRTFLGRITEVRGVTLKDGTVVTRELLLQKLEEGTFPTLFYFEVHGSWQKKLLSAIQGENSYLKKG